LQITAAVAATGGREPRMVLDVVTCVSPT